MVLKSGMLDWNEGLGRLCCRLDIMGRLLSFLGGGSRLEESLARGFRARLAVIVGRYGRCLQLGITECGWKFLVVCVRMEFLPP